jgi:hypothetical protein
MIKFQNKDLRDEQPVKSKVKITESADYEAKTTRIILTMSWVCFSYANA